MRRRDGTLQAGYLPASGVLGSTKVALDLLDLEGRIILISLEELRYVAYVRDFNLIDRDNPEGLFRRAFLGRPRLEGLWLRLTFWDGEVLEGLASLDLALLDHARNDQGIYLLPPDPRSNTQRLYVPRAALQGMQMLAVVTTPTKTAKTTLAGKIGKGLDLPFPGLGTAL